MALKLNTYLLDAAVKNTQSKAKTVKDAATTIKARIDSGPIPSDEVVNIMRHLKTAYDAFAEAKAVPGLNAYAKTEFNDQALDYVAEVEAVMAACLDCYQWVDSNFPKNAGYLLKDKIVAGVVENRVFTQAQTAGLSTALGTLIAAFA